MDDFVEEIPKKISALGLTEDVDHFIDGDGREGEGLIIGVAK